MCVAGVGRGNRKVYESDRQPLDRAIVLKREQFQLYVLEGAARIHEWTLERRLFGLSWLLQYSKHAGHGSHRPPDRTFIPPSPAVCPRGPVHTPSCLSEFEFSLHPYSGKSLKMQRAHHKESKVNSPLCFRTKSRPDFNVHEKLFGMWKYNFLAHMWICPF